jgi:hypothetical protein
VFNDASLMRGVKTRLKGFWCDTMPGTKAVSSMGLPGSSASVKDHSIRATAIYTDLKSGACVEIRCSLSHTVDSPVGNMKSRACTDIYSAEPTVYKKANMYRLPKPKVNNFMSSLISPSVPIQRWGSKTSGSW